MASRRISKFIKFLLIPVLAICLAVIALDQWSHHRYGASLYQMAGRHLPKEIAWQKEQRPSLKPILFILEKLLPEDDRYHFHVNSMASPPLWSEDWTSSLVGPSIFYHSSAVNYDLFGRPAPVERKKLLESSFFPNKEIIVHNEKAFKKALHKIKAGDTITFAPGTYHFKGHSLALKASGKKSTPIRIRAQRLGDVLLQFDLLEGFHVLNPYWIFENLEIEGACQKVGRCEHAFHIVGNGKNVTLRNLFIKNFNSHIKVNGSLKGDYPDGGLLEYSLLINDEARFTDNPVSLIDIVAASGWIVRKSVIADFAKAKSDRISYAGFFKGGGKNNLFEQNLVLCELRHRGGVRLGLSLGGGGTSINASRGKDNTIESFRGILKRNVIANCPLDAGIYLNRSSDSLIAENLLVNNTGIHVRFNKSNALISGNQLDGSILNRDGGKHDAINNIKPSIKAFDYPSSLQSPSVKAVLEGDLNSIRANYN